MTLKLWQFYVKAKPLLKFFLYLSFTIIFAQFILQAKDNFMRWLYLSVFVIILFFNLLFDYLKFLYTKAQKALVIDCDYDIYQALRQKIIRFDLLRGMKSSLILSDLLFSLDQNDPETTLQIINENSIFFSGQLDYLLIKHHSSFKAYSLMNNRSQAHQSYQELNKLREVSNRKHNKLMHQLYNWDQIDGLHTMLEKDTKKSYQFYKNCNTQRMNKRELVHYHYEFYQLCYKMNRIEEANQHLDAIKELCSKSPFIKGDKA